MIIKADSICPLFVEEKEEFYYGDHHTFVEYFRFKVCTDQKVTVKQLIFSHIENKLLQLATLEIIICEDIFDRNALRIVSALYGFWFSIRSKPLQQLTEGGCNLCATQVWISACGFLD